MKKRITDITQLSFSHALEDWYYRTARKDHHVRRPASIGIEPASILNDYANIANL